MISLVPNALNSSVKRIHVRGGAIVILTTLVRMLLYNGKSFTPHETNSQTMSTAGLKYLFITFT